MKARPLLLPRTFFPSFGGAAMRATGTRDDERSAQQVCATGAGMMSDRHGDDETADDQGTRLGEPTCSK